MKNNILNTDFYSFISNNFEKGTFSNEDIVATMMPLLKSVSEIHSLDLVASLDNLSTIFIENNHFNILTTGRKPQFNVRELAKFFPNQSKAFEISEEYSQTINIGENIFTETTDIKIDNSEANAKPIYLIDYQCYELNINHHDPITDIYILGIIMASIAYNIDFTKTEDLKKFVDYRDRIVLLNPKISPSIANIIIGMTELNRKKRWSDINEVIEKLKNYRDYNPETEQDLAILIEPKIKNRSQFIHEKLRNRLFDSSRRNRLLYYQPNLKFLNLTISSVPQVLNYQNISENALFYWNNEISKKIISGNNISLNKYLQTDDNTYIIPTLDKIRLEANKDINEYGFSQLKLVLSFLNWYNTKENGNEKIVSPLLLASVNLLKKKGLKDQYTLEFVDSEIEINPVLSNLLKDLYDIKLPETIQLSDTGIDDIYKMLNAQIIKNNSGIVLDFIEKPRIKLIHTQAVQTLGQYKMRTNKKQAIADKRDLNYSYSPHDFHPLGLEMFKNYVNFNVSSLEFLINKDINLSTSQFAEIKKIDREFFQLDEGNVNPFRWEFDTCNLVLGNFNYKKMSLVRDYNTIIENKTESKVFDSLFNALAQKDFQSNISSSNTFTENYNVVASDATQNKAVKYSEAKESYIIQGPPGTGKSQTIANLIANFVANDKKVLFVCEKRAALDVVFHRLSNQNLGDICCLIHDSQADKKEFILNLKSTFNDFTSSANEFKNIDNTRQQLVQRINSEISTLKDFHQFMNNTLVNSQFKVHQLFDVLISDSTNPISEISNELNSKVGYADWLLHDSLFEQFATINADTNQSIYFSEHPFRFLMLSALLEPNTPQDLKRSLDTLSDKIESLNERFELLDLPQTIKSVKQYSIFLNNCSEVLEFYKNGNEELLDNNSNQYQALLDNLSQLEELKNQIVESEKQYPNWKQRLSETDAKSALDIVLKNESGFFNFLNGPFRQVKNLLETAYSFNSHAIKPKYSDVIVNLLQQFEFQNKLGEMERKFKATYQSENLIDLKLKTEKLRGNIDQNALSYIQNLNTAERKEIELLANLMKEISSILNISIHENQDLKMAGLENIIQSITTKQQYFALYATVFDDLKNVDSSLIDLLRNYKLSNNTLKNLLAQNSLQTYFANNYTHQKYNMDLLNAAIRKVKKHYSDLLKLNGKYIIAKQKDSLKNLIFKSEQSGAGTDRVLKKTILEGRKILENEFTKTIRYKSIRELATSDAGQIIRELKPVWLMSPLSVSDTLPINESYFDVVIFDEASQITLEEGLPPIYRAKQTIIVGDEMQMPPSNFFGSSAGNTDDLWQSDESEENDYFTLDADSFLTQGARKFPSIMLGWHYRSRHEALIGFSNASFYDNKLLTIPDVKDHQNTSSEIIIEDSQAVKQYVADVYHKPISYHYIKNGVYAARSNDKEAEYIAHLVRELLFDDKRLSIGIVAFSMEQQSVIENAIDEICKKDKKFENLLEEEYKRTEENQFVGLFVKNLENVQGDERDIIIMSTCYGYDPKGKMLMNFGPINKRGGEKRLNVIFSRAKKSMVVVSSIKYFDIKNEYNEGANYFRKYLQYAELISLGQLENANNVLNTINDKNKNEGATSIVTQIQKELISMGYVVKLNIGQSKFKCNIGIKNSDKENDYLLGIVVDDNRHYKNNDVLEQYLFKPEILKTNGWKICQVYAKDWLENKERVLQFIITSIKNELIEEELVEDIVEDIPKKEEISSVEMPKIDEIKNANPKPLIETEVISEVKNAIEPITIALPSRDAKLERFIFTTDGSYKFWEVGVEGTILIIQYGRIGTKGQKMIKEFESEEVAISNMKKLITQKTGKGYYKD